MNKLKKGKGTVSQELCVSVGLQEYIWKASNKKKKYHLGDKKVEIFSSLTLCFGEYVL
jgi:hypothetical protein